MEPSSPQGPEDHERLAEDYPSPDVSTQLDMSVELAQQAATQAIEAAAAQQVLQGEDMDLLSSHPPTGRTASGAQHGAASLASLYSTTRPAQSGAAPGAGQEPGSGSSSSATAPYISQARQIAILREYYARNPTPSRKEYDLLAERTGRPWGKIREYFRQRRNKGRGLADLDLVGMEEPGRASGWLQMAYRSAASTSSVPQLSLYSAYKSRFDPYSVSSPLLGGQALIQLAVASFQGCEMAKEEEEYVLKGMAKRSSDEQDGGVDDEDDAGHEDVQSQAKAEDTGRSIPSASASVNVASLVSAIDMARQAKDAEEESERGAKRETDLGDLPEPLRAGTWLLGSYQPRPEPLPSTASGSASSLTQTDLYMAYATRFSFPPAESLQDEDEAVDDDGSQRPSGSSKPTATGGEMRHSELDDTQALLDAPSASSGLPQAEDGPASRQTHRILDPVELIHLTKMTFPGCEPAVDEHGRFVIKGLEARGRATKQVSVGNMFPFAVMSEPDPSDPAHPLTSLLKRKLQQFESGDADASTGGDGGEVAAKRRKAPREKLGPEEVELVEGLKRFRGSSLGQEVRDVCVSQ